MKLRTLLVIGMLLTLTALTAALIVLGRAGSRPQLHGTFIDPAMAASDFELAAAGGPVRKSDFRGRLVVLFFGYTHCPDVCPTTMAQLARAMEMLGPDAREVQVVMVSVDPGRDTPQRMAEYAGAFATSFVGLTGTAAEIDRVAAAFGIYHARAEGSAETGYLVDHTATVTVLDRDGNVRLLWSFGTDAEQMAADLRYLLGR